ncbi:DUF2161 family putative PD-(D/E)XK-type phosphodiesterase, partial [Robertmurraya sp. DFI.2.37]|uniref:DUF2161 family putative PD-(D/E)XK-type phosphodiesterase n=1 Tax=Robertmurraya sp. DFI.2.37 TaxID=3031819 RepID=UPI0023DA1651
KKLRQLGTGDKTLSILSQNHYGWFRRIVRGVYDLSELGKKELTKFPEAVHYYTSLIKQHT